MSTAQATIKEISELAEQERKSAYSSLEVAKTYVITSPEMAEMAAEDLKAIAVKKKQIDELRKSKTRPLDELKKQFMDAFSPALKLLDDADNVLRNAVITFRAEENRKLEAERKKQQEALRIAQEESHRKALEAQQEAEKAAIAGDETTAIALRQQAETQAAIAEAVAFAPPVVVEQTKLSGIGSTKVWKAEVIDLMALVKAVAAGQASIELIQANTSEINKRAKALKQNFSAPGVRVYAEDGLTVRGSR
jgi:hypothetical protein